MRMQIPSSLSVDKANHIAVANKFQWSIEIKLRLEAVGVYEPVIVRVFVVITCDLLLSRSFRVGLDMRMEESTSISHIL